MFFEGCLYNILLCIPFIGEEIFVKDLFKDETGMQHYLINNISMNSDNIKKLFQAKLNIGQVGKLKVDFMIINDN